MTILDTNAFIFDALKPERITRRARLAIEKATQKGDLAICTISLWEVAMLATQKRLDVFEGIERFLEKALAARQYQLLKITPSVAGLSAAEAWRDWDPADRIITATAMDLRARLVTSDQRIRDARLVDTVW